MPVEHKILVVNFSLIQRVQEQAIEEAGRMVEVDTEFWRGDEEEKKKETEKGATGEMKLSPVKLSPVKFSPSEKVGEESPTIAFPVEKVKALDAAIEQSLDDAMNASLNESVAFEEEKALDAAIAKSLKDSMIASEANLDDSIQEEQDLDDAVKAEGEQPHQENSEDGGEEPKEEEQSQQDRSDGGGGEDHVCEISYDDECDEDFAPQQVNS